MYSQLRYLWQRIRGCPPHMWFPVSESRQFVPVSATCLRCTATRTFLPSGQCYATKHPIREHYDAAGRRVPVPECPRGPQ